MFAAIRKWGLWCLLLGSAGVILFAGGFLQEFYSSDIPTRLPALGLRLPLQDPRIEISTQRFVLELWDGDVMVKRYEAGFGRSPVSGRVGGDLGSTPYGEYQIIRKDKREQIMSRGSRFLLLNYPNAGDAQRAREVSAITREEYAAIVEADRAGQLPPFDTALGGPLGIQGNFFFFRERHYTDGSVAIANGDLNELFELVPVGTPVLIHE